MPPAVVSPASEHLFLVTLSFPVHLTAIQEGFHQRLEIPWTRPSQELLALTGSSNDRGPRSCLCKPGSGRGAGPAAGTAERAAGARLAQLPLSAASGPATPGPERGGRAAGAAPPGGRAAQAWVPLRDRGTAGPREGLAAATSGERAGPAEELGYFVTAPSTQASLPPLNETPLLRDVQPLHLIKEIALQC